MTINVDDLVRLLWDAGADVAEKRDYRGIYVDEELDVDAVGIVREWAKELSDAGYMMMRPVTAEEEAANVW